MDLDPGCEAVRGVPSVFCEYLDCTFLYLFDGVDGYKGFKSWITWLDTFVYGFIVENLALTGPRSERVRLPRVGVFGVLAPDRDPMDDAILLKDPREDATEPVEAIETWLKAT